MNQLEEYKEKLRQMQAMTDVGLDDINKLEVGIKSLSLYYDRASNMSDEYRTNFVSVFGQEALDKVDAILVAIGSFLTDMETITNG